MPIDDDEPSPHQPVRIAVPAALDDTSRAAGAPGGPAAPPAGVGRLPNPMARLVGSTGTDSPIAPLPRERAREMIVRRIKELIFDGSLAIGERIPQEELARALGVSSTPLREALIALDVEGIVEIVPHRGAFVRQVRAVDVRDHYDLMATLWAFGIRKALERASADEAQLLGASLGRIVEITDPDEMFDAMTAFTTAVETLAGTGAWRRLIESIPRLLPNTAKYYRVVPESMDAVRSSCAAGGAAIAALDVGAAVAVVETMMTAHGDALVAELSRRDLLA